MKIIEDYADRVAEDRVKKAKEQITEQVTKDVTDEKNKEFIINMDNAGYDIKEIEKITKLDPTFIKQTLAK